MTVALTRHSRITVLVQCFGTDPGIVASPAHRAPLVPFPFTCGAQPWFVVEALPILLE